MCAGKGAGGKMTNAASLILKIRKKKQREKAERERERERDDAKGCLEDE